MNEKAAIPPKSEWRLWRMNVKGVTLGTIDVLAPDFEKARAAVESYCENGNDMDAVDWGGFGTEDGWFEAGTRCTDRHHRGREAGRRARPTRRGRGQHRVRPRGGVGSPGRPRRPPTRRPATRNPLGPRVMSAAMPTVSATHDPTTPEQAARQGYTEMVRLLTRRGQAKPDGMALGSPSDIMLGLTLSEAAPIFIDPFQLGRLRTLLIAGVPGSGKRFIGNLLRLRASWAYPRDTLRVVNATAAYWTDEARAARPDKSGWSFPGLPRPVPRSRKTPAPREAMVLLADHAGGGVAGHSAKDPVAHGEFPGEAVLFLNGGEGPERLKSGEYPIFTEAEHEWLPRARMPKEAGYSEGLLRFGKWGWKLPIAIVASTPEYEFLTGAGIP